MAAVKRDSDRANVQQAEANTGQAAINYGYTTVKAPFDGIVTARLVSIGAMVGATSPDPACHHRPDSTRST